MHIFQISPRTARAQMRVPLFTRLSHFRRNEMSFGNLPWQHKMHFKFLTVLLFVLAGATQTFAQEQIGIGDLLPTLNLKDQNDKSCQISGDTHRLLLVADNGGTAIATQLIESHDPEWLARSQQVFLADIHKMPSVIARFVAIPQLRNKAYPILLGKEESELQMFPRRKDCVTVITTKDGKVSDLMFACNREELQAASTL